MTGSYLQFFMDHFFVLTLPYLHNPIRSTNYQNQRSMTLPPAKVGRAKYLSMSESGELFCDTLNTTARLPSPQCLGVYKIYVRKAIIAFIQNHKSEFSVYLVNVSSGKVSVK